MERSLRFAARSQEAFSSLYASTSGATPSLFGIVQGGTHADLRARSAEGLVKLGFDGYAIGGLSVGEAREDAFRMTKLVAGMLPVDRPRYFMGGGMPEEIVYYVSVGVDMFDCVLPTRNARHGTLFVWKDDPAIAVREAFARAADGAADFRIAEALYDVVQITNVRYADDMEPIDGFGDCPTSLAYSRAYLRHLFKIGETLGMRLATMQNLRFYLRMMEELRKVVESV